MKLISLSRRGDSNNRNALQLHAFTLVELLVVIGIIGLLVAILLPSLNKARRAGNTVACLANLRSIGQALTIYCSENNGYLPGSGNTTGRPLWTVSSAGNVVQASVPHATGGVAPINIRALGSLTVIQPQDWVGPLAIVMGIPLPVGEDGRQRFAAYCNLPQFQCPEYASVLWTPSSLGDGTQGAQQAFSYCEALGFMVTAFTGRGSATSWPGNATGPGSPYFSIPSGYFPKISKVGKTSQKIYAADSNRLTFTYQSTGFNNVFPTPSYNLTTDPNITDQNGNIFADFGVSFGDSHAWDLTADPVNISGSGFKPPFDARLLSFRHGTTRQFGPQGAYYLNAVYFDGHAETLSDTDASNPNLWLPAGTVILGANLSTVLQAKTTENLLWYSTMQLYGFNKNSNWTAQ